MRMLGGLFITPFFLLDKFPKIYIRSKQRGACYDKPYLITLNMVQRREPRRHCERSQAISRDSFVVPKIFGTPRNDIFGND